METCQILTANASMGELTYKIPQSLGDQIKIGQTVIVPVGTRLVDGIVTGFDPAPEGLELKEIVSISVSTPVFDQTGLETALMADAQAFAPAGTHLAKHLWKPPALKVRRMLVPTGVFADLKPSESALFDAILDMGDDATLAAINKKIGKSKVTYALRGLLDKGVAKVEDKILSATSRQSWHFETTTDELADIKEIAQKHDTVAGLSRDTGLSAARINKFIKLGQIVKVPDTKPVAPKELDPPGFQIEYHEGLNPTQRIELYARWGKDLLSHGGSMVVLAPTVFAAERVYFELSKSIQCKICTGGMNDSESHELKTILESGTNAVVVGLAGALFLPLPNLAMIAVDEPHSPMFDADTPFELRLTNLAKIRAQRSCCKLALCGYPHSLESVIQGEKPKEYPVKTDVINMVYEIGSVDQPLVSEGLVKAVNEEINAGRPTVILLNRKGFSNFVYCDECGEVLKCPKCQVPLTYHSLTGSVSCRFCGFKSPAPDTCPSCQSIFIRFKAGGTERLRIELSKRLVAGRLLYAEGGEKDSAKNLRMFGKPGDVLVSTTMMLDRADLSNVKLISIASLDGLLSMPVFSATHKAYALAGILASRLPEDGRLLIQTYMSHHPLFHHIKEKTLDALLSQELEDRMEANYPPYTQLLIWHVVGKDERVSSKDARVAASKLTDLLGQESVIGPNAGYFYRLKGEYRWDILLKIKDVSGNLESLRKLHTQLTSSGTRIEVTNPNT